MIATREGHQKCLVILLAHGAEVDKLKYVSGMRASSDMNNLALSVYWF